MHALTVSFIRVLEAVFALGIAGSALVIILTLIEDAKTLFEKDSSPERES